MKVEGLVPVRVWGLIFDPNTHHTIVVLLDPEGERILPIWIGAVEGNAIALGIEKAKVPRPMTHDLLCNILSTLKVEISRIVITELKEEIFYALIYLRINGEDIALDSRPSDAIALAVRTGAPIYCTEEVLKAGEDLKTLRERQASGKELDRLLKELDPEIFGKYKM
ncbi:MAG: bifunctional nuclease family protein [Deltaproteobacteria bacterium]|nr:MAG: bifunctional nuclease family protein [Deltaproteobacteria bacterium]